MQKKVSHNNQAAGDFVGKDDEDDEEEYGMCEDGKVDKTAYQNKITQQPTICRRLIYLGHLDLGLLNLDLLDLINLLG